MTIVVGDFQYFEIYLLKGAKGYWNFRISDLGKTPDGTNIQPLW